MPNICRTSYIAHCSSTHSSASRRIVAHHVSVRLVTHFNTWRPARQAQLHHDRPTIYCASYIAHCSSTCSSASRRIVAHYVSVRLAKDSISLQVAHGTGYSTFVRKTREAYSIQELFRLYYSMLSSDLEIQFSSFREPHQSRVD